MKLARNLFVAFVLMSAFFIGCSEEQELEPWINPELTDTSGVYKPLDLFVSGSFGGEDFLLRNGEEGYSNFAYAYRNGFCDSVDSFAAHVEVQTMMFSVPSQREGSFYIEIVDCIPFDSVFDEHLDSMYYVGSYPYLSLADSAVGVMVKYIDPFGTVWSSQLGDNNIAGSRFQLSAIIPNEIDTFSQRIAFGEFACTLYDPYGNSLDFNRGKFKGRISNF